MVMRPRSLFFGDPYWPDAPASMDRFLCQVPYWMQSGSRPQSSQFPANRAKSCRSMTQSPLWSNVGSGRLRVCGLGRVGKGFRPGVGVGYFGSDEELLLELVALPGLYILMHEGADEPAATGDGISGALQS